MNLRNSVFLIIALLFISCTTDTEKTAQPVEYLQSEAFAGQNLPFSEAVRVGNMLYLSGQVGNKPGTLEVVDGGIGPETRQSMENIKDVLERYGSSLDEVVKCTCMLADISEWGDMSKVYAEFFPGHKPARSAFAGTGLALGAKVEIECWAAVN